MENPSQTTLSLPEPFGFFFLFLHAIHSWVATLHKFLTPTSNQPWPKAASEKTPFTFPISREDVSTIMGCMGLACSHEDGDQDQNQLMNLEELTNMFEEKEPSLDEVKAAFGVFDENCDGFIDAGELQKVLGKLGFGEGMELGECERMVEGCDENGDGRIEFSEFVKFMETGFC